MPAKFKAIIPKDLNEDAFQELVDGVNVTIKEADDLFLETYKTWKNKPDFRIEEAKSDPKEIKGNTTTSGEGSREHPYPFITKGTSVRFATMTPDFVAKTQPKIIGSGSGQGGVLFIDKNRPRPGIEAREFEETIAKQMQPKFKKNMTKSLDNYAKKSGHAI